MEFRRVLFRSPGGAVWVDRDAPVRGLEAEDAAPRGGLADGPAPVGADGERSQPRGDGGARAARRASGGAPRVPRVAGHAEQEVVRDADPAEGRRVRLADQDRARGLHAEDDGRVLRGDMIAVERRAERRAEALGEDEVLHGERHAVERPEPRPARHQSALGLTRGAARPLGVHGHVGVQVLEVLDPRQHGLDDLDGGDLLLSDGGREVGRAHPAERVAVHGSSPEKKRYASEKRRRLMRSSPSALLPMISCVTPGGSLPLTAFAASPRTSTPLTNSSAAGFAIRPSADFRARARTAARARRWDLAVFARFFMAVCYTARLPSAMGSFTTPSRSRNRTSAAPARSPRPGARAGGSCERTGGRRASGSPVRAEVDAPSPEEVLHEAPGVLLRRRRRPRAETLGRGGHLEPSHLARSLHDE